jgi:hypothetical protein
VSDIVYRAEATLTWHVPERGTFIHVSTLGRTDPDCGETVGTIKVKVEHAEDCTGELLRLTLERLRGSIDNFLTSGAAE